MGVALDALVNNDTILDDVTQVSATFVLEDVVILEVMIGCILTTVVVGGIADIETVRSGTVGAVMEFRVVVGGASLFQKSSSSVVVMSWEIDSCSPVDSEKIRTA